MGVEALRLRLKKDGVLAMSALVESVAGAPIRGSWWGHPKGKEIFRIASALEDDEGVLVTKLCDSKVTFVDRALFAPLYRIVTDRGWRKASIDRLSKEARAIYAAVPARATISIQAIAEARGVKAKALHEARAELEASMLVHAESVHTESGKHVAMLMPWSRWASAAVKKEAKGLELEDARARIRRAVRGAICPLVQ